MSSKTGSSKMKYVVAAGAVVGVGGLLWWMFSPGTASAAESSGASGSSGSNPLVLRAVVTKEQRASKKEPYTSEYWDSVRQKQRENKDAVIASIRARFANS